MVDFRMTDDKPYNPEGETLAVTTAATPASVLVPTGGLYSMAVMGMDETHLLLFRSNAVEATAETIAAVSGTPQVGVNARAYLDLRPVYIEKGHYFAVQENAAVTGLVVVLTLIHQFKAEGFVG